MIVKDFHVEWKLWIDLNRNRDTMLVPDSLKGTMKSEDALRD